MEPKGRILVVDDEAIVTRVLRDTLEDWQVDTATTSEEAMRKLRRTSYEVVVTDVIREGGYGVDLVPQVRALNPTQPILFVTGGGLPDDVEMPPGEGIIFKPFRVGMLRAVMPLIARNEPFVVVLDQGPDEIQTSVDLLEGYGVPAVGTADPTWAVGYLRAAPHLARLVVTTLDLASAIEIYRDEQIARKCPVFRVLYYDEQEPAEQVQLGPKHYYLRRPASPQSYAQRVGHLLTTFNDV